MICNKRIHSEEIFLLSHDYDFDCVAGVDQSVRLTTVTNRPRVTCYWIITM